MSLKSQVKEIADRETAPVKNFINKIANQNDFGPKDNVGYLHKTKDVSSKKWASQLINFLSGELELTPKQVLNLMVAALNHLGSRIKVHDEMKDMAHHVKTHSTFVKSHHNEIKHLTHKMSAKKKTRSKASSQDGSGLKAGGCASTSCQKGGKGAFGRWLKKSFHHVVKFLKGEEKVKPSEVLDGISDVSDFCTTVSRSLKLDTAAAVFAKITKTSREVSGFFKQRGAGRKKKKGRPKGKPAPASQRCFYRGLAKCGKHPTTKGRKTCAKKASKTCKTKYKKKKKKGSGAECSNQNPASRVCKGGSVQAGGYVTAQGRVEGEAREAYKQCKRSMKNSGHAVNSRTKSLCASAVGRYGSNAANYTGSHLEMMAKICPRRRGIE